MWLVPVIMLVLPIFYRGLLRLSSLLGERLQPASRVISAADGGLVPEVVYCSLLTYVLNLQVSSLRSQHETATVCPARAMARSQKHKHLRDPFWITKVPMRDHRGF
jgi:hypothetical protein